MNGRIRIVSFAIILSAIVISVRLYFVQIVHGESFSEEAQHQYVNTNSIDFDRGEIFFQSKLGENIPAALSRTGFTVSVNPSIIDNPEKIYKSLSGHLSLSKQEFLSKVSDKAKVYEEVAKYLNEETADKIRDLNIYGVSISTDKRRYYPGGKLAAQTIGFVGYKGDELAGRYGLERYYEDVLKKNPSENYNNFFAEFFSNVKQTISNDSREQGDIVTSIEPSVQLFLETQLSETRAKWGSDLAGGIVIDPNNGEIFAISSNPTFDLNNFKESTVNHFNNPLVEGVYEMGSIIKPLTMAAGIDARVVSASSTYYDAGYLVLDKKRIENYDGRGRGTVNMQEVLNQSLNTGAAYVALKLGNKKFGDYFKSFGLNTETGIDLPSEARGLTKNLDSQREIEIATASYGQGLAFTPIETVRALSALANGGTLITPHLVKKVELESGISKKTSYPSGERVLKKETSEEVTSMLVQVVDKALREGTAKIPGYSVAAKTGTAQMTEEGHSGYVEGKYLHSFFGYFPAYNPRFLVFLFHTYPKNVQYASETLTDPFLNITKFLINYYQIPPDRPDVII